MKNVYFISDAHLGSRAIAHNRTRERRLVRFLDEIKHHAAAVYMLGDMFDFWYEYRYVVPKGHVRLLGKMAELADMGVEIHFFIGNHDLWCRDYLERECGVIIHREPATIEIYGHVFFLAHGDGLDTSEKGFLVLRRIFHSRFCQSLFSAIHPRWAVGFALWWAAKSRQKHEQVEGIAISGPNDPLVVYAKHYLKSHPDINYFMFGHRHVECDMALSDGARFIILGDWISRFTYAVFDGESLLLENYIEGDTRP